MVMASIFSMIVKGDIPSYKIAEDDKFFAFLDINPLSKGHTLVIPKREVDYIFDLSDEEVANMMIFTKKVAESIKSSMGCKRVAIAVIGMEVPHAHIHLVPINSEGDLDFKKEKLKLSSDEFVEIQSKIALK